MFVSRGIMLAKILSFGLNGINGYPVVIELDINAGLPGYDVVGLADTAIKESKSRVKAAIKNSTFNYPINKIVINLAPADTKKEGSMYDLPIALGILVAEEVLHNAAVKDYVVLGELSLNGEIRKLNGIMPMLISAKQMGYNKFIIPKDNAMEASLNSVEKLLVINLYFEDESIIMDIKNTFSTSLNLEELGKVNYSTKSNKDYKRHGLGLFSALRNNEVTMSIKIVNNLFITRIIAKQNLGIDVQ